MDSGFRCCCGDGSCDSMVKYQKHCEKIRVHQFLMGLDNSQFGTSRSNLLSRESDLTLEKVYSQIVQDINATRGSEVQAVGFSASSQPVAAAARTDNKGMKCSHCGKTGHEVTSCFQLHRFPEWWAEKSAGRNEGRGRGFDSGGRGRGRGGVTLARGNNARITDAPTGIPNFTPEQWNSLANFMNSRKSSSSVPSEKLFP